MGIGVISLVTSQKREPSGSPFTAGSAHNGTSIDTAGKVVLGNDVGDVTAPARLLDDREIQTQFTATTFNLILNAVRSFVRTRLSGNIIAMDFDDLAIGLVRIGNLTAQLTTATIEALTGPFGITLIQARNDGTGTATIACTVVTAGTGGLATLRTGAGASDILDITAGDVPGRVQFRVRGLFTTMAINTTTFCTLVQSDTAAPFNGATLQVSGTHTYRKFDQSQNGTLTLDRDTDSAKVLRNSGALTINFPNFVGANFREGFFVDILVNNAAGITINAGAGRLIHFGDLATSVNGTISSTSVGASCRIYVVDSTTFYTIFFIGAWSLT